MDDEGLTGAAPDAVELLTADHRVVEQLFGHLEQAAGTSAVENQRDLSQRIVRELSVHAAAEEQVLYPTVRAMLSEGEARADDALQEHGAVKHLLAELDGMDPTDERFLAGFLRLMAVVRTHVDEEEGALFPELRQAVGQERLTEMGTLLERARATAPTRPHPHVPDRPPANIVAGAVTAVADRARDAARKAFQHRDR